MAKGKFHPRYSLESLSQNDQLEDKKGMLFGGDSLHDMSHIQLIGRAVDTIRQLYKGELLGGLVETLQNLIDNGEENFSFFENPDVWHLSKLGKSSGFQYKLQNNFIGFTMLIKRFHASVDKCDSHLKIEVSPQAIRRIGPKKIQAELNKLAAQVLKDFKPAGIAIHLAVDVQGWEFPENFETRFITHARVKRKHTGIAAMRNYGTVDISNFAVIYGNTETYTVGLAGSLQVCIYRKDIQANRDDKVEYHQRSWIEQSGESFDKEKPVWRIELRFHHSVIREIAEGMKKEIESFEQVIAYLTDIWRYGLKRNRLELTKTYIDPFWQILMQDVEFLVPAAGVNIRRAKKQSSQGIEKNLALVIGNLVSILTRMGFNPPRIMKNLQRLGCYHQIIMYYESRGKTQADLYMDVVRGHTQRLLTGKAA
ncbi:MAG: hypothetical protein HQL70_11445 [Magnetococcales bacterium]|nr:hypothetical protein [Magnetococcales bacterium]